MAWGPTSYDCNFDVVPDDDETFWSHCLDVYYSGCYASDIVLVTGASLVSHQGRNYITIQYGTGSGDCSAFGGGEEGRFANTIDKPSKIIGIYPNPFSSTAELRVESSKEIVNATLFISDVQGRLVSTISNISSNGLVFERGNLQAGLYFFKLTQNVEELSNGNFVITD